MNRVSTQGNVIAIEGDLVFATVMTVLRQVFSAVKEMASHAEFDRNGGVEISFERVQSADSSMLALCCEFHRLAHRHETRCSFSHVPLKMLRIAELTGVGHLLGLVSC